MFDAWAIVVGTPAGCRVLYPPHRHRRTGAPCETHGPLRRCLGTRSRTIRSRHSSTIMFECYDLEYMPCGGSSSSGKLPPPILQGVNEQLAVLFQGRAYVFNTILNSRNKPRAKHLCPACLCSDLFPGSVHQELHGTRHLSPTT